MSYFYGAASINSENDDGRIRRKRSKEEKEGKKRRGSMLETALRNDTRRRHRKKRASSTRIHRVFSSAEEEAEEAKAHTKTRRHLQKEMKEIGESSRKLEDTSMSSEKDSKMRGKYQRLEKYCQRVEEENEKLKAFLEHRENECKLSHLHREELSLLVKSVEKERLELSTSNEELKSENARFNEDISLLKSLVFRLNLELERYQDKLRLCGQTDADSRKSLRNNDENDADDDDAIGIGQAQEAKRVLESWGRVNTHALAPLLDAYQENLLEKEQLLKQYKREIETFGARCKEVLDENDALHKHTENLQIMSDKHTEDAKMLEREAASAKEQNDLLRKQVALQKQKFKEVHAAYEEKVEYMSRSYDELDKEYSACKAELNKVQVKYEISNEACEKLKNNSERTMPVSVHNASVEECKRLFEEIKLQYESEKKKLYAKIKLYEENQPENEKQLITLSAERAQLKMQIKNLEKTLKRTRHKLENLQNLVYSVQVSRDSVKRQLAKSNSYCEELLLEQEKLEAEKDRLSKLLQKKEKENESIQCFGDDIAQRMGTLKSQLKSVQKGAEEQLLTVEKHIKNQELGLDLMKTEHNRELQRLKQLVKQKDATIRKLEKEKCTTQDNLELVWKAATSDDKKVKDALKSAKKCVSSCAAKDEQSRSCTESLDNSQSESHVYCQRCNLSKVEKKKTISTTGMYIHRITAQNTI